MNIQAANLLSMLSGSEGLGNIQQGLLGGAGEQGGFAAALMEQLGLLGSGDSADMAALQSLMREATVSGDLQNFAAFLGKNPPAASKAGQDIDLDDTLKTLNEVLQQLQQLEADANAPLVGELSQPEVSAESSQADIEREGLADINPMALSLNQTVDADAALETADDKPEVTELFMDVKKPAALQVKEAKTQNAAASADELGVEFDRGISAMMAKRAADAKPSADKAGTELKSGPDLSKLGTGVDGQDFKAATPAGIAADIARMNGAARSEAAGAAADARPAMQKPFGDPGWRQELGDKLIWMHKQDMPSVQLRLNPEHLGPVSVKIDVKQDQASVAFTAHNPAVKEAIEAAIPKLREMLSGQQLNLADVNVSQQQSEQRQNGREFFQMAGDGGRRGGSDGESAGAVNESQDIVDEIEAGRAIAANGLLSLFA
ncbi:flagellar hook-length control protein FliK [Methylomonas sp. SURF-2]|uniref:Flagellar hook-length control protein FliK n=1 Tax=Methylomonas subterranea TaxID=2952225 RepID=A0ABT1TKT5_9GAMM|nr:flagellar hook-length control protein FliK [Methylomonas sp. SURF-2]MCQ8106087.1 flagellar hook-length control protein FliK [Methylomonas sp. SURF-2]